MNLHVRSLTAQTLFLSVATLVVAAGCATRAEPQRDERPISVRATVLSATSRPSVVTAAGTLRSAHEAMVASKVMGRVLEVRKRAGDSVRRGEILIVIDSGDIRGQVVSAEGALAQARAAAVLAETNFKRFQQLHTRGSASDLELDQARFQYEAAKGAVAQAEGAVSTAGSYKSYAEIPSPMDGRVVRRMCEVGDMAAPGHALLALEDPDHLQLHVSLNAGRVRSAAPGDTVGIEIPAARAPMRKGVVRELIPAADPATQSFLVKIDVNPSPEAESGPADLRAGLFGRARFPVGRRRALLVPVSSVRHRGGLTGVMVNEDGRAAFRLVVLETQGTNENSGTTRPSGGGALLTGGPMVEVISGLSTGDTILVEPPSDLPIGSAIEVRQ